jgi:hypothetical protein
MIPVHAEAERNLKIATERNEKFKVQSLKFKVDFGQGILYFVIWYFDFTKWFIPPLKSLSRLGGRAGGCKYKMKNRKVRTQKLTVLKILCTLSFVI